MSSAGPSSSVYADALNRLADRLHYLNSSGDKVQDATRFWFDTRANLPARWRIASGDFDDASDVRGKIGDALKRVIGSATFFDGVHIFTPHGDVPDDFALRLVVLPPEHCYSREFDQSAKQAVLEYVRQNGVKPRYRGNRLIFLASDMGVLPRIRDVARAALAWGTIVDDVDEGRLNIDLLQQKQAQKELKTTEDVLLRAVRECYKWLLCPVQNTPTDPKPTVEVFPLGTGGNSAGAEIERVCDENELVITAWSPIHLRDKLKEVYWRDGKSSVGAMTFWEDSLRYLYLPRLKSREVLSQAIRTGAGSKDFFGTAYGQYDDIYEGFQFGTGGVQIDDTLLLIQPAAAAEYQAKLAQAIVVSDSSGGDGNATTGSGPVGTGTGQPIATGSTPRGTLPPRPRTFYGSVEVNPLTAKIRLVQIVEEIISVLVSDPDATLSISLEINAVFPEGASDQIKRVVSENATALGFKSKAWED